MLQIAVIAYPYLNAGGHLLLGTAVVDDLAVHHPRIGDDDGVVGKHSDTRIPPPYMADISLLP